MTCAPALGGAVVVVNATVADPVNQGSMDRFLLVGGRPPQLASCRCCASFHAWSKVLQSSPVVLKQTEQAKRPRALRPCLQALCWSSCQCVDHTVVGSPSNLQIVQQYKAAGELAAASAGMVVCLSKRADWCGCARVGECIKVRLRDVSSCWFFKWKGIWHVHPLRQAKQ
jgi:hypothetical protein